MDKKYLITIGLILLGGVAAYAMLKKPTLSNTSQLTPDELAALGLSGLGSNEILAAHNQSVLGKIGEASGLTKLVTGAAASVSSALGIGAGQGIALTDAALSGIISPIESVSATIAAQAQIAGATAEQAATAMAAAQQSIADSIAAGATPAEAAASGVSTASSILQIAAPVLLAAVFTYLVSSFITDGKRYNENLAKQAAQFRPYIDWVTAGKHGYINLTAAGSKVDDTTQKIDVNTPPPTSIALIGDEQPY